MGWWVGEVDGIRVCWGDGGGRCGVGKGEGQAMRLSVI